MATRAKGPRICSPSWVGTIAMDPVAEIANRQNFANLSHYLVVVGPSANRPASRAE